MRNDVSIREKLFESIFFPVSILQRGRLRGEIDAQKRSSRDASTAVVEDMSI